MKSLIYYALLLLLALSNQLYSQSFKSLTVRADSLEAEFKYDSAITVGLMALKNAENTDAEDTIIVGILHKLGNYNRKTANYAESESFYKQALELKERRLTPAHPDIILSQIELANIWRIQCKYDIAESALLKAIGEIRNIYGDSHIETAKALNYLGYYHNGMWQQDKAKALLNTALEIFSKVDEPEYILENYLDCLSSLAHIYRVENNYSKARQLLDEAINLVNRYHSDSNPLLAKLLSEKGNLLYFQGKYEQAQYPLNQALDILRRYFGEYHPMVAKVYYRKGLVHRRKKEYQEAVLLYNKSLDIQTKTFGHSHRYVATSMIDLASLYLVIGDLDKAGELVIKSLKIIKSNGDYSHPALGLALHGVASYYRSKGDYDQAEKYYLKALKNWESTLGSEHPNVSLILSNMSNLYKNTEEYSKAESVLMRSMEIREKVYGHSHHSVAAALDAICRVNRRQGNSENGLKRAKDATLIRLRNLPGVISERAEKDALSYSRYTWNSLDYYLSCYNDIENTSDSIAREAAELILTDRKSTRLNSSH